LCLKVLRWSFFILFYGFFFVSSINLRCPLSTLLQPFTLQATFWGMYKVLTFMPTSSPRLTMLLWLCRCPPLLCYTLVLSLLLLGVSFEFNSFWGCLKLVLCALVCFIGSFKPFKPRSNMHFTYVSIELLKILWTNQHGSLSSYCHVGVCTILKEVI